MLTATSKMPTYCQKCNLICMSGSHVLKCTLEQNSMHEGVPVKQSNFGLMPIIRTIKLMLTVDKPSLGHGASVARPPLAVDDQLFYIIIYV